LTFILGQELSEFLLKSYSCSTAFWSLEKPIPKNILFVLLENLNSYPIYLYIVQSRTRGLYTYGGEASQVFEVC